MDNPPIRILLVEDNPADARFLKEALVDAAEPFRVSQVELLQEAVEHLANAPVDAVLLDLFLPDSQGMETVERALAAAPHVPIVILSGLDDEALAIEAVHRGAQDFLIKGRADARSLTRAIRYAVERKRAEEALRRARDAMGLEVQERTADLAKAFEALATEARSRAITQAVVAEQSRLLDAFFRHSITPLVFLDPQFNFVRVNAAYAAACRRDIAEFAGHNHFEFYPDPGNEAIFREVVRSKTPHRAVARPFAFPDHPEWGTTYWDWTLVPILDAAGEVELLVFSLEDVTERKRAEVAVAAERRRFQEVLDKLPACLVLLSPDRRVAFASRFYEERFGKPLGKRCFELLFHRDEPCEDCKTSEVFETNAPRHWEWTGPDGRHYDVYDFPFTDVDGSPLVMKVGLDITERKQAEEQLRSLNETLERRAGQLRVMAAEVTRAEHRERRRLAHLLHDHLQQLLYAARLSVGAIKGGLRDQSQHAPLQEVDELLRESIDTSRSLTVELSPPILYAASLGTALEWLGQYMQEKYALAVQVEAAPDADVPAVEMRILLFHAVRELLFNVVKHADAQWAAVRLSRPDPGHVQIVVRDEGAGFDTAKIHRDSPVAGGFGLFSLRERLELVGGSLEVDSSPGGGTRAAIRAPCLEADEAAAAGERAALDDALAVRAPIVPHPRPECPGKTRVLLADDHKVVREGLARLLREQPDLEVVGEADHGRQAVELALQTQPDVVIMDVSMPILNGIEATRRIVAALPDVRVIGLSMYEEEETANAMLTAGAAAYLPKGGSSAPLIAAIRQVGSR